MLITILICLIVVGFLVALLWSSIVVHIVISHEGVATNGQVTIRALFGLVRLKRKLHELRPKLTAEGPAVKTVHDSASAKSSSETTLTAAEVWGFIRNWKRYTKVLQSSWRPLRRTLHKVRMTKVDVEVNLGTGDAVSTGCVFGAAWSALGMAVGELSNLTQLVVHPQLRVNPDFYNERFEVGVDCIGRIKVGDAIIGVIRMLLAWISIKKALPRETRRPRKEEKTWSTPSRG